MFNVAIDSKLRRCDVVCLKVEDIAPHGTARDRETEENGQPVRFESKEQTRETIDAYIKATPLIIYSVLAIAMVAAIALWVAV